jgi:hypothetical protein
VTIRGAGKRYHPKVNAAGHFSAKVKAGAYRVSASHRSLGSGHASTAVTSGSSASVTVRLSGKGGHKHLHHHRHIRHHLHLKKGKKVTAPGSAGSSHVKTTAGTSKTK